jgi:hypothetical protein
MQTLEAFNHGNGTITVFIREQEHISWLRNRGVKENLHIGDVLLSGEDRRKVYPTLSEAIEDSGAVADKHSDSAIRIVASVFFMALIIPCLLSSFQL